MTQSPVIGVEACSRPSVAELRRYLAYDKATGVLTWKARPSVKSRCEIGAEAGYMEKDGYRRLKFMGRLYHTHVVAWALVTGEWPEHEVDHRDVNQGNNRWDNLRLATRSQNKANMAAPVTNTSGVKGVYWDAARCKWVASIRVDGKKRMLGRFPADQKDVAASTYQAAARHHFGEFARFA
jgi:hypothetical protein